MQVMTWAGAAVLEQPGGGWFFVRAVHPVGAPLSPGQADVPWPGNQAKYISHFPEPREIWSFGSGTAGTRCWARSATRFGSPG